MRSLCRRGAPRECIGELCRRRQVRSWRTARCKKLIGTRRSLSGATPRRHGRGTPQRPPVTQVRPRGAPQRAPVRQVRPRPTLTGHASAGTSEANSAYTNAHNARFSGHQRGKFDPDQHAQGAPQQAPIRQVRRRPPQTGHASAATNEASSAVTSTDGARLSGHQRGKFCRGKHGRGTPQRAPRRQV